MSDLKIEPVTDEDYDAFANLAWHPSYKGTRAALEQDRRRVAERQVLTHETNLRLLDTAYAEIEHLRAENTSLRTLIAVQPTPCVYCGLTEMAKCASGFPGCARADDLICGEDEAFKAVVSERNSLRAEVARLTAACAAKDAALIKAQADLREVGNDYPGSSCYEWCHARADEISAALSTDAGKGWVDASGAVEAEVPTVVQDNLDGTGTIKLSYRGVLSRVEAMIGKRVLIMLKPEAP